MVGVGVEVEVVVGVGVEVEVVVGVGVVVVVEVEVVVGVVVVVEVEVVVGVGVGVVVGVVRHPAYSTPESRSAVNARCASERERRLHVEARASAKEDRAQHDPDVALCRAEMARRATKANPALEDAKAAFQRLLEAEAKDRKGGRPRVHSLFTRRDRELRP